MKVIFNIKKITLGTNYLTDLNLLQNISLCGYEYLKLI
jgi:hypothetical protein